MRVMNELQHIDGKEVDYVLGLLPWYERRSIDQHIAVCDHCRMAINREKFVGILVKQTLMKAGTVNESWLRKQEPSFTKPNLFQRFFYRGQRQFLIAGFMIFLVVASIGLQLRIQGNAFYITDPPFTSTSTLVTDTPTMTAVATAATGSPLDSLSPTPENQNLVSLPEVMLAPVASPPTTIVPN